MTNISRFKTLRAAALFGLSLMILPQSVKVAVAEDILAIATPPQTPADINNFKLTEDLLARMEKIHNKLEDMQLSPTAEEGQDAQPSMDSMVKSIESRPQVVDVMKAENITPRDYLLAYFAMMSALAAADAEEEDQLVDEVKQINPEHVAFGKQYGERIRELIGE
ncbi:hypothetical protein CQ052_10640 [Ochrobactrum sp. MYb15]|uniref:hypothetical protein n=1 Tax=Brucella TaxID=234 RepID=UPI00046779FF|nr:hypothetical protein [Brucella rhizosphaerae]PQZ49598.1 hypothetical protein CQZ90_09885 [Ochrobactrum sp. MYb19]PRA67459.1 hypothetical protein CQ053_08445 [Ochrobactrum sp. MYb18]PRA78085.1 hypothetical protein CQ049_10640 [Brucella thiophenivorans]PRA92478.1 hypothetical protein CQ051_09455 [Ochrobactrum sp. MYb14]PRB00092.1 hypothetical protein CQ052_10640 [Ochrobactrum sp. MYb15]